MQPEATAPSYTHDAFISYSRQNEEFAQALQRALENFKPPKDLKAPQRYLDVFRDKDDFNAGEYFENLEKNLKLSDKLIVICSPEARASDFVNDEIRRFAQIRGKDHIIPILLAGIPNNEAKPGQEKEMAFPEALYEVMQMPLAVNYLNFDVNKDKITKGVFSDAWYTTLANVYEISRSEVEQREKRRRVRRRKITVSVLTASVAVLSVLLVFTLISKREADTQRNRAEDALAGETRAKDDAEAKRKEAVLARNDAEERRKEAVQQREIAETKTKEAQLERDIAEQRTRETQASMSDTLAMRNFSEASARDLQQEIEFDRYRKLKDEQHVAISSGADSRRLKVLDEELTQYEKNISSLRDGARGLRNHARDDLRRADKQWMSLGNSSVRTIVGNRSRPPTPAIFSIEVLNASKGESLILHYGDLDDPRFILIDGGPTHVYEKYLAPRLMELKERLSGQAPLNLDLVIASQSDEESVEGINALTDTIIEQSEKSSPYVNIGTVWFNHPLPISEQFSEYLDFVPTGTWRLAKNLLRLKIPVNVPFAYHVGRPEQGAIRVRLDSGLVITVLNPTPKTLVEFQQKIFAQQRNRRQVDPKPPSLPEETFSGPRRELIKSTDSKKFVPMVRDNADTDEENRASLVLMFEYKGKRFLFTGDANDFQVLEGLHEAGYLDSDGKVRVNVLHIPHQGSDHNVSEEFFKRVIAEHYIITGDGKKGNPEIKTLQMLTEARQNDVSQSNRGYQLQFAHRAGVEDLDRKLTEFFGRFPIDRNYRRIFRPPDEKSLIVNLLDPVRY